MLSDGGAGTGVGQYARTVIAAMHETDAEPKILEDGGPALRRARIGKFLAAVRPWHRRAIVSARGFVLRDGFREAQVFFDIHRRPMPIVVPGPPGVMHWTYPLPMRLVGWRNLYTVHDVMPLDPAIPSPVDGPRLRCLLAALRKAGGAFATVSESARAQITDRMEWATQSIACCHQAADIAGMEVGPLPDGLRCHRYLIYVGAVEDRKNLHRLLDAYHASGITTPLVISGPDGLGAAAIDRHIAATPGAIRLGLQPRATTLRLIADARALVFVSLAEGFGLPVAEAMALGTPVLAADVPALAEVADGATLLVDPLDVVALRNGLITIDGDPALRDRLVTLGRRRAAYFALAPYARRLLNLYATL